MLRSAYRGLMPTALLACLALAGPARAAEPRVKDDASFFSAAVVKKADAEIKQIKQVHGKDFLVEALYPDGKREVLLSVPRYDFNWQSVYRLAEPKQLPQGTRLHCVAHFDNSAKNPNNPDPTEEVHWGDQTWEEMMIGWTDLVYDRKAK